MRDLFDLDHENFNLREHLRKAVFVTENSFIYPLMETFQANRSHLAIVIDEYGSTKGVITVNDILDDLLGNIPDGSGEEKDIIRRNENSWLIDGKCPLHHFKKYFQIDLDEELEKNFVSISGLFIFGKDTVPQTGDQISLGNLTLEIVDKDGNRIDKIMVTRNGEEL